MSSRLLGPEAGQTSRGSGMMPADITTVRETLRIEGLTSTPKTADTMTIEVKRFLSPNLFEPNESLTLVIDHSLIEDESVTPLSALTVAASGWPQHTREALIDAAINRVMESISEIVRVRRLTPWLFATHSCWQQDDRIVRSKRLWQVGQWTDRSRLEGDRSPDVEFRSPRGVNYAGVIRIRNGLGAACETVRDSNSSFLFFSNRPNLDNEIEIKRLYGDAIPSYTQGSDVKIDWTSLAIAICSSGDLLVRVTGGFDDPEVAIDVIANADAFAGYPPAFTN